MEKQKFSERQALGLHKFTGSNRGLYFMNEERIENPNPEYDPQAEDGPAAQETIVEYQYDVYDISDTRLPHNVKDEVISDRYPFDEEHKLLRKTLAKLLKENDLYDTEAYQEFKDYNEFVESVNA